MSLLNDLTAITTPALTDILYCVQNSTDYKITNAQLIALSKTNIIIPLTQAAYDALPSADKNNGALYVITDAVITAADIEYSSGVSVADMLDTTTGSITAESGATIRVSDVKKQGNLVTVAFAINVTNAFSSRTTLGTLSVGFRPNATQTFVVGASTGINYFVDRATTLLISATGDIIAGDLCLPSGNIKEVLACVSFRV